MKLLLARMAICWPLISHGDLRSLFSAVLHLVTQLHVTVEHALLSMSLQDEWQFSCPRRKVIQAFMEAAGW